MKCTILEFNEQTGKITTVRSFDALTIPWQPTPPGHGQLLLDPSVAEQVKANPMRFLVDPATKVLMERPINATTQ